MQSISIIVFIVVLVLIIVGTIVGKEFQSRSWKKVAKKLGIGFADAGWDGYPRLYGKFRGVQVSADVEVIGAGKHKQIFTEVSAPLRGTNLPRDLEVYREGFVEKMGKVVGGEDIQVGDAEIDKAFIVKGRDPQAVKELLTNPSVKRALLIGQKRHAMLRIDYGSVRIRTRGNTSNADTLESFIRTVVELVVCINQASGAASAPEMAAPVVDQTIAEQVPAEPNAAEQELAAVDDGEWW